MGTVIQKKSICVSVPDISRTTIITIIQLYIRSGSIIYLDQARVNSILPTIGYQYHTINHSIGEFVRNGVTANYIESRWQRIKAEN